MHEAQLLDAPSEMPSPVKLLLTPEEAAAALSIKRTFLYHLLKTQQIFSIKVGNSRRIPAHALATYVEHLCELQKVG